MKIDKKSVLLLGIAILSYSSSVSMFEKKVKSKEEILNDLSELYTEISAKRPTTRLLKYTVLESLKKYVENNAQGNKKLLNTLNSVIVVTEDLADKVKTGSVSPGFALEYEKLQNNKKILEDTTFQTEWFFSEKPKTDAKEVLLEAISFIETIVTTSDIYGGQGEITIRTYEEFRRH